MLTNKERANLRSLAAKEKSLFKVGKNGITENMLEQIDKCIEKRELIKISVLPNQDDSEKEIATFLAEKLKAEVVETKGSTLVLYRKSNK